MLPSSIMTFWSLTQAPSTFLRVLVARAMPCWMASSKPSLKIALISVTVATLIFVESPLFRMLANYCLHFAYHLEGVAKHISWVAEIRHRHSSWPHPDRLGTLKRVRSCPSGIMRPQQGPERERA